MSDGWTYQLTFQGETFELSESEQIAGRSRSCDISVPDASVSRKHARLKPGPGHILIQDLNSSNGTFINDRRVQDEDAAEDGDTLRFGDAELRLAIEQPGAYRTLRLPTGGVPEAASPDPSAPSGEAPSEDLQQLRKPPGPATTMLAAESVKLAAQAELDKQAAEAAAEGQAVESIPVIPDPRPAEASPAPATSPPPSAAAGPSPPATESSPAAPEPSPAATQRMELPSQPAPPATPAPEPVAPEPTAPRPAAQEPAADRGSREPPWAQESPGTSAGPTSDTPSPHATQRFDSSSFVPAPPAQQPESAPEPQPETQPETQPEPASAAPSHSAAEPPSSPLSTQRVPLPPSDSAPQADDSGVDPAATRRLEIPPQPELRPEPQSQPAAPSSPAQPATTQRIPTQQPEARQAQPDAPQPDAPRPDAPQPDAAQPTAPPAATVAMTREQLEAARAEIDSSHAPPAAPPEPAPAREAPQEAPALAPASPTEAPAPAPAAETPVFGGGDASQFHGFDFDEDDGGSSEVRPPEDFVPGSGRAWQADDEVESTVAPEAGPSAAASPGPAPAATPPATPPASEAPTTEAPTAEAPMPEAPSTESPAFELPQMPELPQVPDLPMPDASPQGDAPAPSPEPATEPAAPQDEPNFDRPVASWAEKPPMDGDATFAEIEYDSGTVPQPVDNGSWEPPEIEHQRFDRPTPPAAPVPSKAPPAASESGFSQPMPPAAPPPAEMPREERVAGGAGGLLPTLDELDGAIAGPEMDIPPEREPTQPVPVVQSSPRRIDAGAGFVLRAVATLLDLMWISALTLAAWMVSGNDQLVSISVSLACQLAIVVGWALWGTSPGKKALGLAVEGKTPNPEGGGIGFLRAVIRAAGYLVSGLILGFGFLLIAFSADKRGLHDRIAGTWVRRRG